jgi:hypothetical protein
MSALCMPSCSVLIVVSTTNDKKVPFGAQKRHSSCRLSKGSINSPAQMFQNLLQDQTKFPPFQNILFYRAQ